MCKKETSFGWVFDGKKGKKRIASWGQNFMKFLFVCDLTISFNDILSKKILNLTWENHPWKNKKYSKINFKQDLTPMWKIQLLLLNQASIFDGWIPQLKAKLTEIAGKKLRAGGNWVGHGAPPLLKKHFFRNTPLITPPHFTISFSRIWKRTEAERNNLPFPYF